jgi:tRNA pseudouridine32 synthase/23S rRNA pseudouridine746 synthase
MNPQEDQATPPTATDMVLWFDKSLLVVNKPAGLLTLPGGYQPEPHLKQILEPEFGRLWIVHRLDRETSGVLVLARTADAHRALNTQFQEHATTKAYHALVMGEPEWAQCTVDMPLKPNGDRRHRTIVCKGDRINEGKPALTECHVLERYRLPHIGDRYALIEASPRTGRTHQIRAHLAYLGLPIVADKLYTRRLIRRHQHAGASEERLLIARTALHALSLTIEHPITQEPMLFEALYPEDFAGTLRQLRKQK